MGILQRSPSDIPSEEEQLINFAVLGEPEAIVEIVGTMPDLKAANHLDEQLFRSGTFPALAIRHWQVKIINQKSLILVLKLFFTIHSC